MLTRSEVLNSIVGHCDNNVCIVSHLGWTSRDLYLRSASIRKQCLYLFGAMGSVVPLTLGISLAKPSIQAIGIEGDGSLLMNLGSLATLKKYGKQNITIVILDNNQYQSTGGQPSQPGMGFDLGMVCSSMAIRTLEITGIKQLELFFEDRVTRAKEPVILRIRIMAETDPPPRIKELPEAIGHRFREWLRLEQP